MFDKRYLGDGVYVEWDGEHLVLTTEDGFKTTNTIYLEPTVFAALKTYVRNLERRQEEAEEP